MTDKLVVLLDGTAAGTVTREGDRLRFTYAAAWRGAPDPYPLSLSMPLTAVEHRHAAISAFMWGLLPDNDRVLASWAKQYRVSARNPFSLLAHVGEDCAGAVQFVRPDRLDELQGAQSGPVEWIDDHDIATLLRARLAEAATGQTASGHGRFSLAGAQPKIALMRWQGRWGQPSGRRPTTHILKPATGAFDGMVENEHFCLTLARDLGLPTARSDVASFDGQPAIVVERFDRYVVDALAEPPVLGRVHQEDCCQALGLIPDLKYQSEGGPGATDIVRLIEDSVGGPMRAGDQLDGGVIDDIWTFIDALILNWLIGGTDAHAKNYGFLIGGGPTVRLAPLYDIASAYGFDIHPRRMKLAMKIGSKYGVEDIALRHWQDWAKEARVDPDAVLARVRAMAVRMPDALGRTAARLGGQGLDHPVIARLVERLAARAEDVAGM